MVPGTVVPVVYAHSMSDAHIAAQFEHDAWATRQILEAASQLTPEEWRRPFPVGPGSLERTLAHLVEAADFFCDILAGRDYAPRADFRSGPVEASTLRAQHVRAATELLATVAATDPGHHPLREVEFPAGSGRLVPLFVALTQMADHGSHHRAQCLWMLRDLGHGGGLEVHPLRWAGFDPA